MNRTLRIRRSTGLRVILATPAASAADAGGHFPGARAGSQAPWALPQH
jgi:hypothetical protein